MKENIGSIPARRFHGYNVKRVREAIGMAPESLAKNLNIKTDELEELEKQFEIDGKLLEKIAQTLEVPSILLENLQSEPNLTFYANTFRDMSMGAMGYNVIEKNTFNQIEQIIRHYDKHIRLLEKTIKEKEEQIKKISGNE